MIARLKVLLLVCVWCWALGNSSAQADKPPRFVALFANGQRVEGNALTEWHTDGSQPKLDGRALLEPGNFIRWQRDRWQLPGGLPKAFVEMHTGDRFPCVVVDFSSGTDSANQTLPAHFRVRPEVDLRPEPQVREPIIRIVAGTVKRVVWQRRERDEYQPNTLFFKDGRSLQFRAARFGSGFVNVLLNDGNRRVSYNELAEIHLGPMNPWQAYFDELATLALANAESRLFQIETSDGLVMTSSTDRKRLRGNANEFGQWIHGFQPAWSLDVIHLVTTNVWARRIWLPHEVPLCHIAPSSIVTRSPLSSSGRQPQVNRNVQGSGLRAANQDFGWGYGVQAHTELVFELPLGVKSLRGRVGIDKIAGRGGCIRARVYANNTKSAPLWESPFLVGSDVDADLGAIALTGPAQGQKQLILQIDAAHPGRPAGADPLDVRDTADWLDPWIELDPAVLQQEVAKRRFSTLIAVRDWNVSQASDGTTQSITYFSDLGTFSGDFRSAIAARNKPIVLSREVKLGPQDNWLVLFANRFPNNGQPLKLEVRISGEPVAEYDVPFRSRGNEEQLPLAVSMANYQGANKPIRIEIRQPALPADGYVDYRAIGFVEQLPHLYRVFEDRGEFAAIDADQQGAAKLTTEDRYYGTHSVQVTPNGQFRIKFAQPIAIRERPQWGEYRHMRFAFRKIGGGQLGLELNRVGEFERPARYDAGAGEPVLKSATRVWNDKLPDNWIVLTRDLYNDFGSFDATGITLTVPSGQHALFDHLYFGRTNETFNIIPNAPPPELANQMARRNLAKPILDQGTPAVVAIETADGRFGGGVVIQKDGEVLTAGHIIANANQECKVHLPDGRMVKGQTRGICRELDVGLVKITEPGEYRYVDRNNPKLVPEQQLYVGFANKKVFVKGETPAAHIVGIRRVFRGMIWTDFDIADYSAGGPLLDREAKLIGILTKRSEFGGFLFARLEDFDAHLARLRNGEVYGAWYPGLGPMFGINVQSTLEGAKVLEVFPNSPAASANLKAGDIVTKVDGRGVVSLEDIYAVLGEKNAGQDAQIEYARGGQGQQTKLLLVPRSP